MSELSFDKVDKAFAHLTDNKDGQAALREFGEAIERLENALPDLNGFESKYLVEALASQRQSAHSSIQLRNIGEAKEVHGFVIKAAVNA